MEPKPDGTRTEPAQPGHWPSVPPPIEEEGDLLIAQFFLFIDFGKYSSFGIFVSLVLYAFEISLYFSNFYVL